MRILDAETAPYATIFQTLIYFRWLFVEIVKANIAVVRAVLSPNMAVSPTLTRIPTPQKTDIGRVVFANSITLTPGTVSVDVQDDHILVHALLSEIHESLHGIFHAGLRLSHYRFNGADARTFAGRTDAL